jgi:hypothetical protein
MPLLKGHHVFYQYLYSILAIFVLGYLLFKGVHIFSQSLFIQDKDRINIVVYGPETAFYSFDKNAARHYVMYFSPDLKMLVPGGYGRYPVGSLGKLANLEDKPSIFKRTFSLATTSFVDYYFYQDSEEVYYGAQMSDAQKKPKLRDLLFMSSNANILDRLYLVFTSLQNNDDDFHIIDYSQEKNKVFDDVYFQEDSFIKESIGLLFQKNYRDEQKSVQIQYLSYDVGRNVGALLEGNGIRVNDLSANLTKEMNCQIRVQDEDKGTDTARDLSRYFGCPIRIAATDVYDIIFVLGDKEKEWE